MDPTSDDAAIAEFHAAARRRRRRIMAITALVCIAIGAAVLIVTFTADDAAGPGGRFEGKTLVAGIGFLVAGVGSGITAVKGE